jgi:threonine 3-dehydrogenase
MKKEPTEGMWMDTAEEPLLRAGELLIRVKRAAICGTDVHIYKWDEWSQR